MLVKNELQSGRLPIDSALLYGENCLDKSQQPQTRYGKKIRRSAGGIESEERLRRPGPVAAGC